MRMDYVIVIVLFLLAAALPIFGLVRALRGAIRGAEQAHAEPVAADEPVEEESSFDGFVKALNENIWGGAKKDAWTNVGFVGVGLTLGAIASIWSLFLQ